MKEEILTKLSDQIVTLMFEVNSLKNQKILKFFLHTFLQ